MLGRAKAGIVRVFFGRLLLCAAVAAAGGAGWVNPGPGPAPAPERNAPKGPMASAPLPPAATPNATAPGLVVTAWSLGGNPSPAAYHSGPPEVPRGRPFYIRLTLEGGAAALDAMQAQGGLPIVVHWTPETAPALPPAPALSTRLVVGDARFAARLAGEVAHKGRFTWHSWAEKDTLSPGRWSVSLTYPGGEPLVCGAEQRPCRFSFEVG